MRCRGYRTAPRNADRVNELFGITPDHDLNILRPGQSVTDIMTRAMSGLDTLFAASKPDAVIV